MKQKSIKQLIDASGVQGFEFDNDETMYAWWVTPGADKMLAKRVIECDDGVWEDYFAVPYADMDACEELYDEVVFDFVECYAEDLYFGSADTLSLFGDVASKGDDGLLELLSFFDKTYDEFLLDVFYWYGQWVEDMVLSDDDDEDELMLDYSPEEAAEEHLVKSVLRHLGDATLCVDYGDDDCVYWEFAVARGEIWYRRADIEFGVDMFFYYDEYGHVSLEDPDGMGALRDAVLTCFGGENWYYEEEGDALGILGLKEEDLFEE